MSACGLIPRARTPRRYARKVEVGRALEQAETLEREAKLFHERLQSLADRAKGLEAFAQEHALRCAYEER